MKFGKLLLGASAAGIFLSLSASADPQIDAHVGVCVNEGGQQVECLCTATAIKEIGTGDEQYGRAVETVQTIGHAAMMQLYQQAMSQNPDHQAAFDAAYQTCLDAQSG